MKTKRTQAFCSQLFCRPVSYFARFIFFVTFLTAFSLPTMAGILRSGDAVVTGFSGTLAQPKSPGELFDTRGPAVRGMSLGGSGAFGLIKTNVHFTVTSKEVGQVFGVALDDNLEPNIYVAATSAYGLAIYQPGGGRLQHGAAGAQYMIGQFGETGGPSTIWRIDGKTGQVSLFANVVYQDVQDTPASLGGLAFDPKSQQLFVVDRATGLVHRFTLDGTDQGVYDHGVEGLTAAGQAPKPFDITTVANINDPHFNTQDPSTWGQAPPERRLFALAVHMGRLYYSVYGPSIWSVGITAQGPFANDTRFETDVSALQPDIEVSAITFDRRGYMYIAERGRPTGNFDFINVAHGGQSRVMRFKPQTPTAASPSFWQAPAEEYAIGMLPEYQNADGGVALTCGRTIWSTGDRLMETDDTSPHIEGLQGNDIDLIKPANSPPTQSWFINYYDQQAALSQQGRVGSIVIWNNCNSGNVPGYILPPTSVGFSCPAGTYYFDGACFIPPTCPAGTTFENGQCVWPLCPWGQVSINNECVPPPVICDYQSIFYEGLCVPVACPPPLVYTRGGYCQCPNNTYYDHGHCVPPVCPQNEIFLDGRCVPPPLCPFGQIFFHGWCVPPPLCPPNQYYAHGRCIPTCPNGEQYYNGRCAPPPLCPDNKIYLNGRCVDRPNCRQGEVFVNGRCVPPPLCPDNKIYINGHCVDRPNCRQGEVFVNGRCVPPPLCPNNKIYLNGRCIDRPNCRQGDMLINGRCVPPPLCPNNKIYINGKCIDRPICPRGQVNINGRCTPPPPTCKPGQRFLNGKCITVTCPAGKRLVNSQCVTGPMTCPTGQMLQNGKCRPITIRCPAGKTLQNGKCVLILINCPAGQTRVNGKCISRPILCPAGQVLKNGRCITVLRTCPKGQYWSNGQCITRRIPQPCAPGQKMSATGTCISILRCPSGQMMKNGRCISVEVIKRPVLKIPPMTIYQKPVSTQPKKEYQQNTQPQQQKMDTNIKN